MRKVIVAPSILSASWDDIENELKKAEDAGAKFIHLDVMDGRFVPQFTFRYDFVMKIHDKHHMVNDVHLMIDNPLEMIPFFAKAGADIITFHYESLKEDEIGKAIDLIHGLGKKAGISIKPMTEPDVLLPFLPSLDLILVMSVEPGKGGQSFMNDSLRKISFLRKALDAINSEAYLEVDGGINAETGKLVVEAGADTLVAGSFLYGHNDFKSRAEALLKL